MIAARGLLTSEDRIADCGLAFLSLKLVLNLITSGSSLVLLSLDSVFFDVYCGRIDDKCLLSVSGLNNLEEINSLKQKAYRMGGSI